MMATYPGYQSPMSGSLGSSGYAQTAEAAPSEPPPMDRLNMAVESVLARIDMVEKQLGVVLRPDHNVNKDSPAVPTPPRSALRHGVEELIAKLRNAEIRLCGFGERFDI